MSKGRKKMHSLARRVKRRRTKKRPVSLTRRDHISIGLVIFFTISWVIGISAFVSSQSYRRAIERRVERLRNEYDLDESQVQELLALELQFHAYQKTFSFRHKPTAIEMDAHRKKHAKLQVARSPD